MKEQLNNIAFIFPVMVYYVLESLIVSVFIMIIWKLFLSNYLGSVGYFQIAAIYWIVKMLFFDVFKLISGLHTAGSNMEKDEDNSDYNEGITE